MSIHIIELESGKFRTRRFIESSLEHGEHEQQVQKEKNAARFNKERRDSGSVRGERQRSVAPPSAPHLASRADVVDSCRTGSAAEKTGGSSERHDSVQPGVSRQQKRQRGSSERGELM